MMQELFRFTEDKVSWCYTSGTEPFTHAGNAFAPLAMRRTGIEVKKELSRSNQEISVPLLCDIAQRWMLRTVDTPVFLTIYRADDEGVAVIWKGRMTQVQANSAICTLLFETVYTALTRNAGRRKYQRTCPHVLYGHGCFVDRNDFQTFALVTAVAGDTLVSSAFESFENDWFSGGILSTMNGFQRLIRSHTGDTLILSRELPELSQAYAENGPIIVKAYPGCDRSVFACKTKFSNAPNYGGFPTIPVEQPRLYVNYAHPVPAT